MFLLLEHKKNSPAGSGISSRGAGWRCSHSPYLVEVVPSGDQLKYTLWVLSRLSPRIRGAGPGRLLPAAFLVHTVLKGNLRRLSAAESKCHGQENECLFQAKALVFWNTDVCGFWLFFLRYLAALPVH